MKVLQNKSFVFGFLLFLLAKNGSAQFSEELEKLSIKYPESSHVRLNQESIISLSLDDDEIEIRQTFIEEDIYLDEAATQNSQRSLSFSSFFEIESVEAISYQYRDGKYRAHKVDRFTEKDELDNSFHDDTKSLNFIYPNLSKGGKTKLEYTVKVKNPRFLSPIYFGNFYPIKNRKVTLIADKAIDLRFQHINMESSKVKYSKEEKRGNIIYTWEISDVDEYKYEPNIPSYNSVLPHIVPIITTYGKDKKETLLNDVGDLYKWYYSIVKDVNTQPSSKDLIELTNSLITDASSDLEKVKAIYYWTQQNIKYIDFEYGLGGFIPREANDVFNKKYGDCKDNSSILYEMLKIAGLNGHLTWLGTRSIPYKYEEVPTPIVDNHMILTYIDDGEYYYLDATGRYLPIDLPSAFIQGKEALIAQGHNNYIIEKVPVVKPEKNFYKDHSIIHLEKSALVGNSEITIGGYYKMDFYNDLENENSETKIKDLYNRKLRKGNNKFDIVEFKETDKFSYDNDFKIDIAFEIEDYPKIFKDELYVNLNLNKELSTFKTRDERVNSIEVRYQSLYEFETQFNIPDGYQVEYLPEDSLISNEYFESSITYEKKEEVILYSHHLKMKYIMATAEQQKEINQAIKEVEKIYKEIVILKKEKP